LDSRTFDRSILDQDYPDTPVVLLGVGCHDWFTNTAVLQRAGYNVEQGEEDPVGGKYELRPDGSLTGELKDQVGNHLMAALPKPAAAHVKRVVQRAIVEIHCVGYGGARTALDAFEIVYQMRLDGPPRHEAAHCARVLPGWLYFSKSQRHSFWFKQLNITAEISLAGLFVNSQSENLRLFH
jgi:predicted amidohydrolase YtcJ